MLQYQLFSSKSNNKLQQQINNSFYKVYIIINKTLNINIY